MEYVQEIEFKNEEGEWDLIEVTFTGEPTWDNDGIGSYEYWGQKCYDAGTDYMSFDYYGSPEYDKSKHTPEEIAIIDKWLETNLEDLEDSMIKVAEKESNEY